jgi:protein farnesyltransferase/geranylgeranyltransferase type-1 subunit alpha
VRYKTLIALGLPLEDERARMDDWAIRYLKNYQVWHHRRLLLAALRAQHAADPAALHALARHELDFVARALRTDEKNYHTWAYRQWILASAADAALWADELPWVTGLLADDVRNNSAWHHRFYVVWQSGVPGTTDAPAVLARELQCVHPAVSTGSIVC